MDIKNKKQQQFKKALASLREVLSLQEKNAITRDSAIQRFEYTSELFWKMLKEVLKDEYGIIAMSPKSVIREAVGQNIFSSQEGELFISMMNDRNRTSHAYEESIAEEIEEKLDEYSEEMGNIEAILFSSSSKN